MKRRFVICLSLAVTHGTASADVILFVDDDAPAGGDGMSWRSSFANLQDALAAAKEILNVSEIRVAQGVYKPDIGGDAKLGDSNEAFDLVNNVALLGGYAGLGAPNSDERDITAFATVLTGDLAGNDGPNFANYQDNTYRVVRAIQCNPETLLEGFTIIASQMQEQGKEPWPIIGGGLYCTGGGLTIWNCRFERNWAHHGGGVAIPDGSVKISNCVFVGNKAQFHGGGMLTQYFMNSIVDVQLEDCSFINNTCEFEDGGAITAGLTGTTVRRCTFIGNFADDGGAVQGRPLVEDCTFSANHADYGGAVSGGGTYRRCRFESNAGHVAGGAASSVTSGPANHPRFIECDFVKNQTNLSHGGASSGGVAFINCRFVGNVTGIQSSGGADGGAIHALVPVTIVGCSLDGNFADGAGGAISVPASSAADIINCTFASNSCSDAGGAVRGPANIVNSIFWNHDAAPIGGAASMIYSCAPLASAPPPPIGMGNIDVDPLLIDVNGPDGIPGTQDDDLRLSIDSPVIDCGNSLALPADAMDFDEDSDTAEPLPLDAFASRRVLDLPKTANLGPADESGAVIDMGFHEYRRPSDVAPLIGDGNVDVDDLLAIINNWGSCWDEPACPGDVDGDSTVNLSDLVVVLTDWDF